MKITDAEKTWHLNNKEGIDICSETNPLEEENILKLTDGQTKQ